MMSLTLILTLGSLSGYGAKAVRDTISLNLQEVKLERFVEVMKQKTPPWPPKVLGLQA